MKKEEFLKKLRKNLSVLEEGEIQDIVEEYEQHIDMKMKEGLTEEAAIKDFGELGELTAGILEAYHVKADYSAEKTNFDKVKEEGRKATEKATSALGKGAGALGKGAGTAGKWGLRQMKKLMNVIKWPFAWLKRKLHASKQAAQGRGFLGRLWLLVLGFCNLLWRGVSWCIRLLWNLFCLFFGIFAGVSTLGCIFLFGVLLVLLVMGYPVVGATMITVGGGLISSAVMLFCFSLLQRKSDQMDKGDTTKDSHIEDSENGENNWEYPEDNELQAKQITVNSYQEVFNHA